MKMGTTDFEANQHTRRFAVAGDDDLLGLCAALNCRFYRLWHAKLHVRCAQGRSLKSSFSAFSVRCGSTPMEIAMLRLDKFERYPLTFGPTPIEYLPRRLPQWPAGSATVRVGRASGRLGSSCFMMRPDSG
jgi:hypothetical protein